MYIPKAPEIPKSPIKGTAGVGNVPTSPLPPPFVTYIYGGAKSSIKKEPFGLMTDSTGTIQYLKPPKIPSVLPRKADASDDLKDKSLYTRRAALNNPSLLGQYNPDLKTSFAKTPEILIHEHGHNLDHKIGYPSRKVEFMQEALKFPEIQKLLGWLKTSTVYSPDDYVEEVFANVWMWAGGKVENIPATLRNFFMEAGNK